MGTLVKSVWIVNLSVFHIVLSFNHQLLDFDKEYSNCWKGRQAERESLQKWFNLRIAETWQYNNKLQAASQGCFSTTSSVQLFWYYDLFKFTRFRITILMLAIAHDCIRCFLITNISCYGSLSKCLHWDLQDMKCPPNLYK